MVRFNYKITIETLLVAGTLFHIDFGYILGKDAKLKATIAPYMRITPEMKEAMVRVYNTLYVMLSFNLNCVGRRGQRRV